MKRIAAVCLLASFAVATVYGKTVVGSSSASNSSVSIKEMSMSDIEKAFGGSGFGGSFSGNGVGFGLLERDNVIGLQHAVEPFGNHRRVAAIDAFGGHCVFVADKFRAATRTGERVKGFRFVVIPFGAGVFSFPLSLLRFSGSDCRFLFIAEKFFNRADFKFRAAVFASNSFLAGQET